MNQHQRKHIDTVVETTSGKVSASATRRYDQRIRESWRRCVDDYGLDPCRMQDARILTTGELRAHQENLEEFRRIAHHGIERLFHQIAPAGYVVLLNNAKGITVDYLGDANAEISLQRAGLFLGAEWSETYAGTCAVGTVLATGEALTVHQDDHFDATHIPLTCTAVPLFDPKGPLHAVLDISALSSPQPKSSQQLAMQIAGIYAGQIENAYFEHLHRGDWILKLSAGYPFVNISPDYLIAFDDDGKVVGHNHHAQRLLLDELQLPPPPPDGASPALGRTFEQIFDLDFDRLPHYINTRGAQQRTIRLANGRRPLFLTAQQPAGRRHGRAATPSAATALPAPLSALSGGDPALQVQLQRAMKLVDTAVNLFIHGETGCGKEYLAKALHQSSRRRQRPFIAVNCAAIPASLIESELFGAMPGSFSGAGHRPRRGLIQEADGGTLFLDEIGDMPLEMQTRLLRVLAEREVLPVGATRPVPVDIRVISASHQALERLIAEGRFREDLYYRLHGARITLPPLRERRDADWLIDTILSDGRCVISAQARERLHQHRWPGNLRELRNVLEYACAVCDSGCINPDDLPEEICLPARAAPPAMMADETGETADAEKTPVSPEGMLLMQYLRAARWNHSAVARQLGISRMTLYRRMQRLGIRSPNQSASSRG
ncbi:sigma-54-dependent Fis family transcriptional regulator [Brenneria populi]|uniref:Sigma-54-dependent Fis family transcriptional regulator n=1 Tax=Brenneria populi TaxID=1505588 RepID=A0ABU6JVD1_9GAMM|nr:sigma-54-dependent Fis family transcriptional regulator [Brenneria populi Li et al. 2015]